MFSIRPFLLSLILSLAAAGCATAPTPPAASAPAVAESDIPADLQAFASAAQASFLSKDIDRFMSHFHPDYRGDGKNLAAQRHYVHTEVFPFVTEWEYRIQEARVTGDKAVVKALFVTEFGNVSGDGELVRKDGQWLWYGNRK